MHIFEAFGPLAPFARALLLTAGAIVWTLLLARLVGLRAFSKATAFDFAATIATGSLIAQAGTRSSWPEYAQAIAAIGAIFLLQFALSKGRLLSASFADAVDNAPLLLMEDGQFIERAMREARVTKATLLEKIRGSGAASVDEVGAMVLETTGDITLIDREKFDPALLEGVRRVH
jgi:uncharacterized membrane protein YcaP (DUF421 family)